MEERRDDGERGSAMTATDELRKLLDERGVEHDDEIETFTDNWKPTNWTRWRCADGEYATYHHCEQLDIKRLVKYGCTPEQAIAATLGKKPHDKTEEWLLKACNQATQDYVKALEKLVQDWQELYENPDYGECLRLIDRMRKLGIEVEQ